MASIWEIIEATGNVLDLPGSSVRDVLALENPLDQWLTPTTGENRVGGRQLLDQWGITPENEETGMAGWLDNPMEGVRDVAGFAVEATLDPLNLVSGSAVARAFKGGAAARKANQLRDALLQSPERSRVLGEMTQSFGPGAEPTMDLLDSFALGQQGMPPEAVYSRLSAGPAAPMAEDVLFQGAADPPGKMTPAFTSKVYDAIESPKFPKIGSKETMVNALKKAGVSKRELEDMMPEIDRAVEFADQGKLVRDQLGAIAQDALEKQLGDLTVEVRGPKEVQRSREAAYQAQIRSGRSIIHAEGAADFYRHNDELGAQYAYNVAGGGDPDTYFEMFVRSPSVVASDLVDQHWRNSPGDQYFDDVLLHVRGDTSEIPFPGMKKTARLLEVQSDLHQAGRKYGYTDDPTPPFKFPAWERDRGSGRYVMPGTDLSLRQRSDENIILYKDVPVFGEMGTFSSYSTHADTATRIQGHMNSPEFRNVYRHREQLLEKWKEIEAEDPYWDELPSWEQREAMQDVIDETISIHPDEKVPRAPFEKDWPELSVKLFLDKIIKDGHDSVFLPDGDQLAKHVGAGDARRSRAMKLFYDEQVRPQIEKRFKKYGVKGERYDPARLDDDLIDPQLETAMRAAIGVVPEWRNSMPASEIPGTLWKIPPEFAEEVLNKGQTLYQPNRGQAAFSGDSARLSPLENPDFSTPLHESGHVMRRMLGEANPDLARRAGELFGGGQQWDRAAEERFAQGLERYAQTARPESPALRQTMDRFRPELDQLYQDNPLADLNQAQTAIYDEILGIRGQLSPLDRRRSPSMAKPMLAMVLQNMAARQERM